MKFGAKSVRAFVVGCLLGIYQPLTKEPMWEWAERTLRIPATENEEMAGTLWKSWYSPYVRELMAWLQRPGKSEFWVKKSSQTGITMAVLIMICWMIVNRPANTLYAINSLDEARKISISRLKRWIEDNQLLKEVNGSPDDLSNLTYFLRGMTVHLIGAHSPGAWKNKSVAFCVLDELDEHDFLEGTGSTVNEARSRVKRPKNAKILGFSTPGRMDHIHGLWESGTKEEIRFPFPCCGHMQALKWENFRFGTKEFQVPQLDPEAPPVYDREKVRKDAYFECELCGGRLRDEQKMAAMQDYESVPTAADRTKSDKIRSLHLWDGYSYFVHFGDMALRWIDAQGKEADMQDAMQNMRGERYERNGKELKASDVLARRGSYERGRVNFRPLVVLQATDIQDDVVKSVKGAFDGKGNLYLIDWQLNDAIEDAADWLYDPVMGRQDEPGSAYAVSWGIMDEGFRMKDVRALCLDHEGRWFPIKGRGHSQIENVWKSGLKFARGCEEILVYQIREEDFKWQLLKMIADDKGREKKGLSRIWLPGDVDEHDPLVQELCNERPEQNAKTKKWEWKKKGPNDYWDCVKYLLALWAIKETEWRALAKQLQDEEAGVEAPY